MLLKLTHPGSSLERLFVSPPLIISRSAWITISEPGNIVLAMPDLNELLPAEVLAKAVAVGNELLIPFSEALVAVSLATDSQMAVLGVESFQIVSDGFKVLDYSGYQFVMEGDWVLFVTQNNRAAEQYIREKPLGAGCGYILTAVSRQQFDQLSTTK